MNELNAQNESYALMGSSTVIRHACHLVTKLAEGNNPLLIIGELGTGKDVIAKLIHQKSALNSAPFLQIKCYALKDDLLDVNALNSHGTLYFDEVDKLSPKLQEDLFKMIKSGIATRNSLENKETSNNIRIICATAVDLDNLTRQGRFSEDLLYSLSSTIYLPPLRERREDIPILADHFIQKLNQMHGKKIQGLSSDALSALLHYSWKNNIQELENLIERVIVFKNGSQIEICDLPPRFRDLITDNIDNFYNEKPLVNISSFSEKNEKEKMSQNDYNSQSPGRNMRTNFTNYEASTKQNTLQNLVKVQGAQADTNKNSYFPSQFNDAPSIIDRFVKKEIDLGSGIDFYKIVEEFENRLIFEALRRTNQNKNRAAQLLSMNRTTLVEKLKKRASSSFVKTDTKRSARNPAFTIFDELGSHHDNNDYTLPDMNENEREKESNP